MSGTLFLIEYDTPTGTIREFVTADCRGYQRGQVPPHLWQFARTTGEANRASSFRVGYYHPAHVGRVPRNHCAMFEVLSEWHYSRRAVTA